MARQDLVRPACPKCGEPGKPVMFGLPAPAAVEAAKAGLLITPGCLTPDDPDDWQCRNGHSWRVGDRDLWGAVIRSALRGRPRCPKCGGESVMHVYPGTIGEELLHDEIASGDAVVAGGAGPPGVNWDQLCKRCGNVWSPSRHG